jgi:hypothetical protein
VPKLESGKFKAEYTDRVVHLSGKSYAWYIVNKYSHFLTRYTGGNVAKVNFSMSARSISHHTHLFYVMNLPHWILKKTEKFPLPFLVPANRFEQLVAVP